MVKSSKRTEALLEAINRGYDISKQGIVTNPKGKIIHGCNSGNGYLRFTFRINGKFRNFSAHQLQAYIKFGEKIFDYPCIRHFNDNKEDNSWDNIGLGTHKDNASDRFKNGYTGSDNVNAIEVNRKLTDKQCIEVYNGLKSGVTQKYYCIKFGLSKSTMSCLIRSGYYKKANGI